MSTARTEARYGVFFLDREIGSLVSRGRRLEFAYAGDAAEDPAVPALSLRLPKRAEPFGDAEAGPYFANLLPEGDYRKLVADALGTSAENMAGLLGALGGECAGAVSLWPHGERPASPPEYRTLSPAAFAALFDPAGEDTLGTAHRRARLSVAGAQEKLALRREGDAWWLPVHGAPSTHILKRARRQLPELVENELFCVRLAAASGLPAARADAAGDGPRVFVSERYDRVPGPDGRILRLHQEDFCQALGVFPERKYQAEGGPGFDACAELLRRYSALPVVDLRLLVWWAGFNWLVGNCDAHAKNLAFLYGGGQARLAPFYDLVSTWVYRGLTRKAAMKVGTEYRQAFVRARHWDRFAAQVQLPARAVRRELAELTERAVSALPAVHGEMIERFGPLEKVGEVARLVEARAARLRADLAAPA